MPLSPESVLARVSRPASRRGRAARSAPFALALAGAFALALIVQRSGSGEELRTSLDARALEAVLGRLQADMNYLASDELAGRDVGTPGIESAAQHVYQSFARSGLQTELYDSTPFQTFNIPIGAGLGDADRNRLILEFFGGSRNSEPVDGEAASEAPDGSEQPTDGRTGGPKVPENEAADATGVTEASDVNRVDRFVGALGNQFRPLAIGGNGVVRGPLVFAGYGITDPNRPYDDYAGVSAQGSIVLVLRKEPHNQPVAGQEGKPEQAGVRDSRHAFFETKIRNAAAQGAIAVCLINDPQSIAESIAEIDRRILAESEGQSKLRQQLDSLPAEAVQVRERMQARLRDLESMVADLQRKRLVASDGLLEIGSAGNRPYVDGLPVVSISRSLASRLVERASGKTLDQVQAEIDASLRPNSFPLQVNGELETELTSPEVETRNVIGVLPGRGPLSEQTVVIGAHYDHVGMGGPGSLAPGTVAIHNGADDNASGTSVMLASVDRLTQMLASSPAHRRLVFIAFTGEERGLLGSQHYVQNPRFPLESTVAMLNLDMVGRLRDNDLTVYGTGTSPGFDELVERANRQTGFSLFKVASGYGPSDHQSFYEQKIPVLFFFTGLHSDYHRPSDKPDKINFSGMARITDLTASVAYELATSEQPPGYVMTDREVKIRQQARAFLGVALREGAAADGQTVLPDSVFVTAITPGSPAEAAGVRVGDRLVKLDDVEVRQVAEVIEMVGLREADVPLRLQLERAGERIELTAILKNRPGE